MQKISEGISIEAGSNDGRRERQKEEASKGYKVMGREKDAK